MDIIQKLKENEPKAILEGLAMMAYNPSIGRVLEKRGVDKFVRLMSENVERLTRVRDQAAFDAFHDTVVDVMKEEIKTNKGEAISYGQAQKPLNVFLKVFVDWANMPTLEGATTLKPFLHVPLDSILMGKIKEEFSSEYSLHVVQEYDRIRDYFRANLAEQGKKADELSSLKSFIDPSNFSLSRIFVREMYYAWQKCLRSIYPEKPILLDVFWSMNRGYDGDA
jgi:hypothetical protein